MTQSKVKWTFLKITHLLLCLALGVGMAFFFAKYTPAKQIWASMTAQQERIAAAQRSKRDHEQGRKATPAQTASDGLGANLSAKVRAVTPILWPDCLLGVLVLLGFSVGTGVYVRRLDIWISFHGSGQLEAVRSIGIQAQTLQSNVGRKGGIE